MWRRFVEPPRWTIAVVIVAAFILYTYALDRGPAYIGGDEAHFVAHAHAIANTGRDLNGTRWPLFVKITDLLVPNNSSRIWYQPVLFYLLALDFRVFTVSEWSARLPTTTIAVLDVWLVYLVGRRLFNDRRYGLLAAALLALTPAHYIISRQALDYICPLPFMLGWLLCLLKYFEDRRPSALIAGCFLLGVGAYSYISSWVVMPFLLLTTLVLVRPPLTIAWRMIAASAVPILLVVVWIWRQPQMLFDTVGRYRLPAAGGSSAGFNLAERITVLWDYFNPSFLFFAGGSNPTMATSRVGVFLLPMAVMLGLGVYALLRERTRSNVVLLLVFAAAPIPIALTMPDAPSYSIARAFTLVPSGVLIAVAGCAYVFRSGARWQQAGVVLLLLSMPIQFRLFLNDYFTDYQTRSAPRIDPVATRDVMPQVIALDQTTHAPQILFSDDLDDKSVRWKFYAMKANRDDLWERARYFNADRLDPATLPANSLLVIYANDPRIARLLQSGACVREGLVTSVSGDPAAAILRRRGETDVPR